MIPDSPYGNTTASQIPSPITTAMLAFSATHGLLDRLNAIINQTIGEEPPMPAIGSGAKPVVDFNGNLGELSRSSAGIHDRIEYTQRRLDALQQALTLNT